MASLVVLPYLLSLLLGRTVDLNTYRIGAGVYDDNNFDQTSIHKLNATYHVVRETSFPYEQFGMPVDIALRIKSGFLSSSSGSLGLDGLLRNTAFRPNSVLVAVSAVYNTVRRTLPENATLLRDWQTRISESQTHFASGISLGGWFAVLYRFRCDVPSDADFVSKLLINEIGSSGQLDSNIVEIWHRVEAAVANATDVRGRVVVETHVFSSVQLKEEIESPESLDRAIKSLPETIMGGVGEPLFVELQPLSNLDSKYPNVGKSNSMVDELSRLDRMLDDVRMTRTALVRWVQETTTIFEEDEEARISSLLESINNCLREFHAIVGIASLYAPPDHEVLSHGFRMYLDGLERGVASYDLAFRRLKEEIDAECGSDFLHGVKGLLKVYEGEGLSPQETPKGIEGCQGVCLKEPSCRAIGYSDHVTELDLQTGNYYRKNNQCWIFYRSTSTAIVSTPNGLSGDIRVYDRKCH